MQKTISTLKVAAKLFGVCLIFFTSIVKIAQLQAQDCDNYHFSMTNGTFSPGPIGTFLFTPGSADALSNVQPIGFNFNYCGVIYSQFVASSNGLIYLGNMGAYPDSANLLATVNSPVLAAFWDHLKVSQTGRVSYYLNTSGGPGHFVLLIDFINMQWFYNNQNNLISFQIRLDEQSGIIEFEYASMGNNPGISAGASIGIANKTAGVNHFLSVTPAPYPALSTFSNWMADDHITAFIFPNTISTLYEFVPYFISGSCEGPHLVSVSNITPNSAVVNWIPPLVPASFFNIYYSLSPFDLNEITPLHQVTACVGYGNPVMYDSVPGNMTSYTLNGLLPNTTYYIWVRSSCAVNQFMCSYSNWMPPNTSGGSSFHTLTTATGQVSIVDRPFAVDFYTGFMHADGMFDVNSGQQHIGVYLLNNGTSPITNVSAIAFFGISSGILMTDNQEFFDTLQPGIPVLGFFTANFIGSSPGKHTLTVIIQGDSFNDTLFRSVHVLSVVPITPTSWANNLPEGSMKTEVYSSLNSNNLGSIGFMTSLKWTVNYSSPYIGQFGPLAFKDPWWKVVGAAVGVAGAATWVAGAVVTYCGAEKEGELVEKVGQAALGGGALVAACDSIDPFRRGQAHTLPGQSDITFKEEVVMNIGYSPNAVIGTNFSTTVNWTYSRFTNNGILNYSINETAANYLHYTTSRTTNINKTLLVPGENIILKVQAIGPQNLNNDKAYFVANILPHNDVQNILKTVIMRDDGHAGDSLASDGIYTGIASTSSFLPGQLMDIYIWGFDLNNTAENTNPLLAAQEIGGVLISTPGFGPCTIIPDYIIMMDTIVQQTVLNRIIAVSGSYAPWGSNQFFVLDSLGNAAFYNIDVVSGATDSAHMSLTQLQMQSIMDTASAVGFYGLNSLYDGGFADGSGVYLNIVTNTGQNEVEVINYCNNDVNRIMRTINAIIFSSGKQLRYGEIDQICP